jgi:hypothetical protein
MNAPFDSGRLTGSGHVQPGPAQAGTGRGIVGWPALPAGTGAGAWRGATESDMDRPTVATTGRLAGMRPSHGRHDSLRPRRMTARTPDRCVSHVPRRRAGSCHQLAGRGWSRPQTMRLWFPSQNRNPATRRWQSRCRSDKRHANRRIIINLVRLINRHINHLRIGRNNFNVAAVINHLLLRRGLQVAEIVSRLAQPLDGSPSRPAAG